jgi:hypothetical protein
VAERLDEIRKARDVAAARHELAQPPQEDHHRQGDENGVSASVGDHQSCHQATRSANADRKDRTHKKSDDAGIGAAIDMQDPGDRQSADVGREGNGKVDPARDDRHQHGERQQPEFGQLEGNGIEGGERQEARRQQAEHRDHRDERQPEADRLGAGFGVESPPAFALAFHHRWRQAFCHDCQRCLPRASICPSGALESDIAMRMIAPTIILNA